MEITLNLALFKHKISDFLTFLDVEKNASAHTLRAYESDLTQLLDFWEHITQKEPSIQENVHKVIQRYTVSLFYRKISKTSLARKFSSLRAFLTYLKKEGFSIEINFKAPRLDKKLPTTLSVDEICYLLDGVKIDDLPTKYPYRDKAIFEMIYATGVRCSELINIKLEDIDFHNQLIRIFGKGKKERVVLFGSKAQARIEEYLLEERSYLIKQQESPFLFLNCNGEQLTTRSVQRIFEMFRTFLKVDRKLTPHNVRHSFATHLLSQGVNLRIIQELLGHKTLTSTEIYTHVSNKQLSKLCDEKHPLNELDHLVLDDGNKPKKKK